MPRLFLIVLTVFLLQLPSGLAAKPLSIVTDIAPVRSLVEGVTRDLQATEQLIPSNFSPHDFALKPSDIRRLQQADLIIWLGPEATPGLAKVMRQPALAAKAISLMDLPGTKRLDLRRAGIFGAKDDHEDAHAEDAHGHFDPHGWLDPSNAAAWVPAIAAALQELDAEQAGGYGANAAAFQQEIAGFTDGVKASLKGRQPLPYVQFHDAFQYFETAFGLSPLGAATSEDEETTSLGVISELRTTLAAQPQSCVFVQDKLAEKRASVLLEVGGVQVGYLDALGRQIAADEFGYIALMSAITASFSACLLGAR